MVNWLSHSKFVITSPMNDIIGVPPQLSEDSIPERSGKGTWSAHVTIISPGQIIKGAILSTIMIDWLQLTEFPAASDATQVRMIVNS